MMAVLTGSELANLFSVLHALCHKHLRDGGFGLSEPPELIGTFEKMGLVESFWSFIAETFGYSSDAPSVAGLLRSMLVTELLDKLEGRGDSSISHFQLPAQGRHNAVVCLTQWRDSSARAVSYSAVAEAIEKELKLADALNDVGLEACASVFTIWGAERRVASLLKNRVLEDGQAIDVDSVREISRCRKAGHWLSGPGCQEARRHALADAYDAIVSAAELFVLKARYASFGFDAPSDVLSAYRDELYQFDSLYRQFCVKSDAAVREGWDLLKALGEEVERVYDQGYLQPLGLEWARLLDAGFLDRWQLERLPPQQSFYSRYVAKHLAQSSRKRAYVIVSDAFRYEAARELTQKLNGEFRMDAKLEAMLGVLPSYTSLGMASLLPHKRLSYTAGGEIRVDGQRVGTTETRGQQLATVDGMACQARELAAMKLEEARDFTKGKRVVYIYHNVIDARGDSQSTEMETFAAVEDCIRELVQLVQFCINKLNAGKVWITADHGFLFRREEMQVTDKTALSSKPDKASKIKKRYVIGQDLGRVAEAHCGYTRTTAGTDCDTEFWVPRGSCLFHFAGGARFTHGGAMPQEVVIPVVEVTQLRDKQAVASRSEKVSVQVLGSKHKVTTGKHRFELIQTAAERALRRQGRPQGPDQADQGGGERASLRAGVSARHVLRLRRRGDHPRRAGDGEAGAGRELRAARTRRRRSSRKIKERAATRSSTR
jgi:uncharacterized protein (TIGR02687 family)